MYCIQCGRTTTGYRRMGQDHSCVGYETWATIGSPVEGHSGIVTSIAFSRNGEQLASASGDGTVRMWDVTHANCVGNCSSGTSLSERAVFSVDSVQLSRLIRMGKESYQARSMVLFGFGMHVLTRKRSREALGTAERCVAFLSVAMDCEWRLDRMTERYDCGMRRRVRSLGHLSKAIQER